MEHYFSCRRTAIYVNITRKNINRAKATIAPGSPISKRYFRRLIGDGTPITLIKDIVLDYRFFTQYMAKADEAKLPLLKSMGIKIVPAPIDGEREYPEGWEPIYN